MLNPFFKDEVNSIQKEESQLPDEILDPKQVNWYFRKIKALKEENKSIDESADQEVERINTWREMQQKTNNNTIERFQDTLLSYYRIKKDQDKDFKINTPYGKISDRKTPKKWNYQDEDAAVKSLEESGEDDFIKKTLNKKSLKQSSTVVDGRVVTENGVPVDGIEVEPQGRSVTVSIKED